MPRCCNAMLSPLLFPQNYRLETANPLNKRSQDNAKKSEVKEFLAMLE